MKNQIISCGTFVVLSDTTLDKNVIFGKNSGRPQDEVQSVVYVPGCCFEKGSKLKCTFIEIDQAEKTYSVVLSKPSWMWGAEIGSNEFDLVIGNEAIHNINTDNEKYEESSLVGQDFVRLALERCKTAAEALDVITSLLSKYGQKATSCQPNTGYETLACENSFLIADKTEAYVLETVGRNWAIEQISSGYRNISNNLTITNRIYKMSEGLKQYALDNNLWNETEEFNFSNIFASKKVLENRKFQHGKNLLNKFCEKRNFDIFSMLKILRDTDSQICRSKENEFPTQASQISILNKQCSIHWFTGTPDAEHSVYKPFIFLNKNLILTSQISEPVANEGLKHLLYLKHENTYKQLIEKESSLNKTLRNLEESCILELQAKTNQINLDLQSELSDLFNDVVEAELRFYK